MCGIAGYLGETDTTVAAQRLRSMVSCLVRRGPDAEGLEVQPGAALGHRRLSIFDLSEAGRQPMLSVDGTVAVVFNGAIYNFPHLRNQLEQRGFQFRTRTDTEVLIHGYQEWGFDELIQRIEGMFAIGLWDRRKRRLFLVRDRLGVKPLVYAASNGKIAFASTVRALKQSGLAGEVDPAAVAEFLEYGYVTDARTIYAGVEKLPAATMMEWYDGKIVRTVQYWTPPPVSCAPPPRFDDAVDRTEELLLAGVKKRLFADVPVGALLSGGVDSSLICWAIAQLGGDVTAFTVGTPGDPWDETEDARAIATKLGIPHQVLETTPDDSPSVRELVSAYGEPFACASALGMLKLSRVIKESATVLLTGDGGDDVFLGYPEHKVFWMAQRLAQATPKALVPLLRSSQILLPQSGKLKRARNFLGYASNGLSAVAAAHDGLPGFHKEGLLGDRLAGASVANRQIPCSFESARCLLTDFLKYDRTGRFVGEYITKVDGATMHYALEARSPFFDQHLWEFASALPYETRLQNLQLKAVLRALSRRHLGDRVANGRKRGFGIPVQRWLTGRWRPAFEEAFRGSLVEQAGWLREEALRASLERAAVRGWAPVQLWYAFVLENWMRHEFEQQQDFPAADGTLSQSVTAGYSSVNPSGATA